MNKAPFSTLVLSYADWRDCNIHMVNMCYRDLQVIVDVLDDYSKLLQKHIEENPPKNFWAKYHKEELVKRTMQISDRLADAINWIRPIQSAGSFLPDCSRNKATLARIGEEALTLSLTRSRHSKTSGKETDRK